MTSRPQGGAVGQTLTSRPQGGAVGQTLSDVRVGAGVLAVIALAVYLAFGGPLPFNHQYTVDAVVQSANELHGGSPVRIAGVNVGKVTKVRPGPGTTAIVQLAIDGAGRPIHRDATLKIRPRLFLEGNFYVDLRPGSPSAPELRDGGTIPLAQTATPVQLDQVLSALNRDTRDNLRTLVEQAGGALDTGGAEAIDRSFAPAVPAYKGLAVLAQSARGRQPGDLRGTIADTERIVRALNDKRDQLASLVSSFNVTAGALASRSAQLQASLRGLSATLGEASPALADISASLPELRRFAGRVRPLLRRSPQTLDLAAPLLVQLDALLQTRELPALLASARPAVATLRAVEGPLTELLAKVTPVSECVRDHATPVLKSKLDDGTFSTNLPVYKELLDGLVGLASASQNFDGDGPAVRYNGGYGEQLVSTGRLPSGDRLFGTSAAPLLGSRPRPPAMQPPFRPDVPCVSQDVPKLAAPAAPPAVESRRVTPRAATGPKVATLARRLAAEAGR
jgi:phospholipid/cholesterol/gamma-HCH transport system substrate-binding protein